MSTAPSVIAPVAAPERLHAVDLLRGWALLGILTVNIQFFAWPLSYMFAPHEWGNALDNAVDQGMRIFAEGKFYTLFSTLFGWGFSIYLLKGERAGRSVMPLYLRRIFALMGIGAIHAYLIWMGDILLTYSLIALPMLLFRKRSPKALLRWAVVMALIPTVLVLAISIGKATDPKVADQIQKDTQADRVKQQQITESALRVYPHGSFAEVTRQRASEVNSLYAYLAFYGPSILAMFLMGLYIGRTGILHRAAEHLALFRKVLIVGIIIGLAGSAYYVLGRFGDDMMGPSFIMTGVMFASAFGHPALAYAYASALLLLYHRPGWATRLHPVVCAGRMALTNYLMQSLICTFIFYSHGLGKYGSVPPRYFPFIVLAIYAIELAWSPWWLQRFHYGPAEWLWRSLTYAKIQPMRIRHTEAATG